MEESAAEYFAKQNNWEESFITLEDFIGCLNKPSIASGQLGRTAATTISRLNTQLSETQEEIAEKDREIERLREGLIIARDAINGQPIESFGDRECPGTGEIWPIRDELVHRLTQALANHKEGE
jgi:hypothetical protein